MKLYELTYLISPDLSEEEIRVLQEKINSLIQEEGRVLPDSTSNGGLVRKTLAHPIKKNRSAFLSTLSFQLNPEELESLEKKLKAESKILRYLILTKPVPKVMVGKEIPTKLPRKIIKPKPKVKVELKEIEKKLEEILGE